MNVRGCRTTTTLGSVRPILAVWLEFNLFKWLVLHLLIRPRRLLVESVSFLDPVQSENEPLEPVTRNVSSPSHDDWELIPSKDPFLVSVSAVALCHRELC